MKTRIWLLLALCLFTLSVMAEEGPADVRRHMIRGVAAIEIAKSNAELTLAAEEFKRATELDPSLSAAWYNLGSVQAKLVQFDAAIESYKRYLTLVPKAEDAQKVQDEIVKLEFRQELAIKSMSPEMVVIPPGSFEMGSNDGDSDEKPVHTVRIARPFALGKTEVTQGQWKAVMGSNPSYFKNCGDNCPVEAVSWDDVQDFIRKLNAKTSKTYRLPSEAEWEYAAKAGAKTKYPWGDKASREYANYGNDNYREGFAQGRDLWINTAPVSQFPANAFGLYDMHGNVSEWVEDCRNDSYNGAPSDGSAWTSGDCGRHIVRGGSWLGVPQGLTSTSRAWPPSGMRNNDDGFRLARTIP